MKSRNIFRDFPIFSVALIAAIAFAVVTWLVYDNMWLSIAEGAVTLAIAAFTFIFYSATKKKKQNLLHSLTKGNDFAGGSVSENFPLPILVTDMTGRLIWNNQLFENTVTEKIDYSEFQKAVEEKFDVFAGTGTSGVNLTCADKQFSVYSQKAENDRVILYFADNTKLRTIAEEFMRTRPAVVLISIDGMEDVERNYRASESSVIRSEIENLIEAWLTDYEYMKTRFGENTFAVVTQFGDVEAMAEKRFDILDDVRAYTFRDEPLNLTLSIGVGASNGVSESEEQARQSLAMAFGRGGDQAVARLKDEYEFYGGVSKSVEKQSRVRTRIISDEFCKHLEECGNVIIMGHKYPDLDALGSAFGIVAVSRAYGKDAYIVTDAETALSKPLIDYMSEKGFGEYIVSKEKAEKLIDEKSMVVVTDTHVKGLTECPDFIDRAGILVVIDHHRQAVDYIDNAVIFYLDPSASSASELVARLIQFLPRQVRIGSYIADALLSGIMLDTKNFVLRAGISTFEAAAYLKGAGADTIRVKRLFADSMNQYKSRSRIIADAQMHKNCAVSICSDEIASARVVSAQAADELLNIKGTDASFVIFKAGENICVSARSFGKVNVQLIMEAMGGGGHQTMAAAQFKDETANHVFEKLISEIDKYFET